jgi:hypothetical protein
MNGPQHREDKEEAEVKNQHADNEDDNRVETFLLDRGSEETLLSSTTCGNNRSRTIEGPAFVFITLPDTLPLPRGRKVGGWTKRNDDALLSDTSSSTDSRTSTSSPPSIDSSPDDDDEDNDSSSSIVSASSESEASSSLVATSSCSSLQATSSSTKNAMPVQTKKKQVTFAMTVFTHKVPRVTAEEWPLVFYEHDEIAEFRYQAFLEDCGLGGISWE